MKKLATNIFILFSFFIAVILRLFYLLTPQLNSDYANIGLAARHILNGEFPLFFYGTPFEGVIEGYLAVPLFCLFGSSRFILDCVPALMAILLIFAVYKLAKTIFGDPTAKLALLFSAVAPPYFLTMTTVPMEGYIETAILGAIAFMITYKIIYNKNNLQVLYLLLGIVIGFAFYLHFHIVPFFITIAILLLINDWKIIFKKYFLFSTIGFLIGNIPLILYNITHNWNTLHEIGKGIDNSTFPGTLKHLFNYGYQIILGAKSEGTDSNYIPYVSNLIVLIYLTSFLFLILRRKRGSELLIIFLIIFPVTYWLSGRGEINTRRYLIPLYSVIPIILAYFLNAIKVKSKILFYSLSFIILGSNIYTNYISIPFFNKSEKTQYEQELKIDKELYGFLRTNNIKGAYALSWWVSLKFNFDFKEDIIFNLVYDEPYPKYQKIVDCLFNPAVVSYFSELVPTFNSIGGTYKTHSIISPIAKIPPYNIYYDFSPAEQTLEEINNSGWAASSSHNSNNCFMALDRDISTRWHSDTAQIKYMRFTLDMGKIYNKVTRIIYNPGPVTDWPCGYSLYTSTNGRKWRLASRNSDFIIPVFWNGPHPFIRSINGLIEIDFKPRPLRYLKLVLTKDKERFYWSIAEFFVYRQINTKGLEQNKWDLTNIKNRLNIIKPAKIYADPWTLSNINAGFYGIKKADTIDNNYIHKYFIVELSKLKNSVFIVLQENYSSFIKMLGDIKYISEDYGHYKVVTFSENYYDRNNFYWDGFHLLKCTF